MPLALRKVKPKNLWKQRQILLCRTLHPERSRQTHCTQRLWYFIPVWDLLWPLDQQTGMNITRAVMQSFCAHGHQKAPGRMGAQLLPWLRGPSWRGELPHRAPGHFSQLFMQLGLSLGEALRARRA